jgi:hypothetical protein
MTQLKSTIIPRSNLFLMMFAAIFLLVAPRYAWISRAEFWLAARDGESTYDELREVGITALREPPTMWQ